MPPAVTITTPLPEVTFDVVHVSGTEALGQPFAYAVDVKSSASDFKFEQLLGEPVRIQFELQNDESRYIHGHVAAIQGGTHTGNEADFRLAVRPSIWKLGCTSQCRIFQNETVPAVITAVLKEHGLSDFDDSGLTAEYRTREYLTQYRESDLNFITRLMEQEGIYYYFVHEEQGCKLILADSISAHEPIVGAENVPFRAPGQQGHSLAIHSWSFANQVTTNSLALTDYNYTDSKTDLYTHLTLGSDSAFGKLARFDYPGEYEKPEEGPHYNQVGLEALKAVERQVSGHGGVTLFYCGGLFTLEDFPGREEQNVEHLLTQVHIELAGNDRKERFQMSFEAIPSEVPFRLPRSTRKSVVAGPQTATVVGKDGEEIWTDEYGRVKLKFHWDSSDRMHEDASCWVRVSQQWAGSNWGSVHTPRIGQEVIVSFLEGDPDRPIVTGRVYNNENMPPYLPANPTQSGIKSRSTKGGLEENCNEIRLEDKKGEEQFFVQAEKDMQTVVKNDESRSVGNDQTLQVTANQSTTVGKNRTFHVVGSQQVSIDGEEANAGVTGSAITIKGEQQTTASKNITIDSETQIQLRVGQTTVTITPQAITLTTAGGATIELTADILAQANGQAKLELNSNASMQSQGGSALNLDTNAEMSGTSNATVSAGASAIIEANMSASMAAAGGKVVTDMKGVSAEGPNVSLDGKLGVVVQGLMISLN